MAVAIHMVTLTIEGSPAPPKADSLGSNMKRILPVRTRRQVDMLKPTDKSALGGQRVAGLQRE